MPEYRPATPSRAMILWTAAIKRVSAFLDSTWARVDSVMRGYLDAGGERHVSESVSLSHSRRKASLAARNHPTYVRAMERMPPPAAARAWATLSFWGTGVWGAMAATGLCCSWRRARRAGGLAMRSATRS